MSTKLKIMQITGDNRKILDLEDAPEEVLMDFCGMILRHHNLRNPDSQSLLKQLNAALKKKSEKDSTGKHVFARYYLKAAVEEIESILNKLTKQED